MRIYLGRRDSRMRRSDSEMQWASEKRRGREKRRKNRRRSEGGKEKDICCFADCALYFV